MPRAGLAPSKIPVSPCPQRVQGWLYPAPDNGQGAAQMWPQLPRCRVACPGLDLQHLDTAPGRSGVARGAQMLLCIYRCCSWITRDCPRDAQMLLWASRCCPGVVIYHAGGPDAAQRVQMLPCRYRCCPGIVIYTTQGALMLPQAAQMLPRVSRYCPE